jgi:hypothetical protein
MSKTYQTIMESFNNTRVKDMEFDSMVEDIKILEKGVNSFKTLLLNINIFFQSIKTFSTEMNTVTRQLFEKNSPYVILINEIEEAHNKIENFYDDFNRKISNMIITIKDWDHIFNNVKCSIVKREQFKKTYEHYDEKLEKIFKSFQDKIKRNSVPSQKEKDLVKRVLHIYHRMKKNTKKLLRNISNQLKVLMKI